MSEIEEKPSLTVLIGEVSGAPVAGTRADGSNVLSFDVATTKPRELVPVSVDDATEQAGKITEGAKVFVVGRTRKRFYRAGPSTRSITEVYGEQVVATSA